MSARAMTPAVALALLAACAPTPQAPAEPPPAESLDPYAAALAAAPAPGQWTFLGDDGTLAACFGPSEAATEAECQLSIICQGPTREITVRAAHPAAPEELVVLVLFNTPDSALNITAYGRADNRVSAELADTAAEHQPLLDLLSPAQDRFAIEIAGEITTYPWHDSIGRTLAECG